MNNRSGTTVEEQLGMCHNEAYGTSTVVMTMKIMSMICYKQCFNRIKIIFLACLSTNVYFMFTVCVSLNGIF